MTSLLIELSGTTFACSEASGTGEPFLAKWRFTTSRLNPERLRYIAVPLRIR